MDFDTIPQNVWQDFAIYSCSLPKTLRHYVQQEKPIENSIGTHLIIVTLAICQA